MRQAQAGRRLGCRWTRSLPGREKLRDFPGFFPALLEKDAAGVALELEMASCLTLHWSDNLRPSTCRRHGVEIQVGGGWNYACWVGEMHLFRISGIGLFSRYIYRIPFLWMQLMNYGYACWLYTHIFILYRQVLCFNWYLSSYINDRLLFWNAWLNFSSENNSRLNFDISFIQVCYC